MRIGYDYQAFSIQRRGGVSRYFWELARSINRHESNAAKIICPWNCNDYLDPKVVPSFNLFNGHFRGSSGLRAAFNWVCARSLYGNAPFDIVHETFFLGSPWYVGSAARIVTVHDMIHELFPQHFASASKDSQRKQAAVRRADHVICVSHNTRRDLLNFMPLLPEDKVSVVYHGIAATAESRRPPELVDRPYFLYVGPRAAYKNFTSLLKAFAASSTLRDTYSLYCFGGPAFTDTENEQISSLGLDDLRVRRIDDESDEALRWMYENAVALVYPSRYEGFGLPPLEAMSYGCPVACSNTSSLPEVAGPAARFFSPDSVGEIRAALEEMAWSPALRADLVRRGRDRAAAFSWDACARNTAEVYRLALANRRMNK